jgi:hypothetical protein
MVDRCNYNETEIPNDVVKCLCTQIRAMVKEMRVECSDLLCQIKQIPDSTVVQMI